MIYVLVAIGLLFYVGLMVKICLCKKKETLVDQKGDVEATNIDLKDKKSDETQAKEEKILDPAEIDLELLQTKVNLKKS